jgi:hypothetical protein
MQPVEVLRDMTRVSEVLCIWIHYYDEAVVSANKMLQPKFDENPRLHMCNRRTIVSCRQSYVGALNWPGYCAGMAPFNYWLTKDSLFDVIESLGFSIAVGKDTSSHPNGPAITLFTRRKGPAPVVAFLD